MVERREQAAPEAVLTRIGQVVMLHHGGDREGGPQPLPGPVGGDRRGGRPAAPLHPGPLPGRHPGRPGGRTCLGPAGAVGGGGAGRRPRGRRPGERPGLLPLPAPQSGRRLRQAGPRRGPPAAICAGPAPPRASSPTSGYGEGCGPRSAGWRCVWRRTSSAPRVPGAGCQVAGAGGGGVSPRAAAVVAGRAVRRAPRGVRQRPYAWSQILASGLSLCQPPVRPAQGAPSGAPGSRGQAGEGVRRGPKWSGDSDEARGRGEVSGVAGARCRAGGRRAPGAGTAGPSQGLADGRLDHPGFRAALRPGAPSAAKPRCRAAAPVPPVAAPSRSPRGPGTATVTKALRWSSFDAPAQLCWLRSRLAAGSRFRRPARVIACPGRGNRPYPC